MDCAQWEAARRDWFSHGQIIRLGGTCNTAMVFDFPFVGGGVELC